MVIAMDPTERLARVAAASDERRRLDAAADVARDAERAELLAAFDEGIAPSVIADAARINRNMIHKLDTRRRGGPGATPRRHRRVGLVRPARTSTPAP